MERRAFVQSSLASACALAAGSASAEEKSVSPELYEWRIYTLKPGKQAMLDTYLKEAFLPGCKRAGCGPVGVFTENGVGEVLKVHVLIVHPNGESAAKLASKLAADAEYVNKGKEFLEAKAADPVYARIESSLLGAIDGMPKLAKPDATKPRLLNLRIYESHNERANDVGVTRQC